MVKLDPSRHVVGTKLLVDNLVYVGQSISSCNPKMKPYIHKKKNRIYIINLSKTLDSLTEAYNFLMELSRTKGENLSVIFIGTKPKNRQIISEEALRSGVMFVDERWLGGTLTNFDTIKRRISSWIQLERSKKLNNFEGFTKKEKILKEKEIERLTKYFRGIRTLKDKPDLLIIADVEKEKAALAEAKKLNIPVIAIVNTNNSPVDVKYVIPGNNEMIKSVNVIFSLLADAIIEGRGGTELKYAHSPASFEPIVKREIKEGEESERRGYNRYNRGNHRYRSRITSEEKKFNNNFADSESSSHNKT